MATGDTTDRRIPRDDAVGMTVGELMIAKPKTLPSGSRVADVRHAFENPSVRTVLLADGDAFRGAIERELLPPEALADEQALTYADTDPVTASPSLPVPEAIELLDARAEPRLIVLDDDG